MLYDILLILYFIGPIIGLWFIFKKAGEAPYKSLIPIYNIVVWIKICGKDWKWYLYFLVPAINIFTYLLLVVETAKIFRRNGLLEQTIAVLVPFVYLPWLGINKKLEYVNPEKIEPRKVSKGREWAEAIIFALVAAVIIRGSIFELYSIPSSSMEKSLLIGDHLMVSKLEYGARVPTTILSIPLVHNVIPGTNGKVESYLRWIELPFHRFKGTRGVRRFDATVFGYPDGDTVCTAFQSNRSYHDLVREYGYETVHNTPSVFGKVVVRPIDKRENFIKRCIGLPGETIEIRSQQVYINGEAIENPKELQYTYAVRMSQSRAEYAARLTKTGMTGYEVMGMKFQEDANYFNSKGVSRADCDISIGYYSYLYLNDKQIELLKRYEKYISYEPMEHKQDSLTFVRLAPKIGLLDGYEEEQRIGLYIQSLFRELRDAGVSGQIMENSDQYYTLPLTSTMVESLKADGVVAEVIPLSAQMGYSGKELFPHAEGYAWSVDNFGPVAIPSKGMTIELNTANLPIYRRAIEVFEGNTVEVKDGQIRINGEATNTYTFKMDYYWMMGDNRHNSADSRYWGFVPDNHLVGRAKLIYFSRDKEHKSIRFDRTFKTKL